jgi:hypothetical protein
VSYPALVAAEAKWNRGGEDLKALHERIARVLKGQPYQIEVKFDRESGWHTAYARVAEKPLPDLSVLVGATAYQFLSALNLIVWELAARKVGRRKVFTEGIRRDIAFPISAKPADFESLRLHRYVSKQATARLRGVQPYMGPHGPGGPREHPLFLIKALADADKHRLLTAVFGRWNPGDIKYVWDRSVARNPTFEQLIPTGNRERFVHDGTPLSRVRFEVGNTKAKVGVDRQPAAEITFHTGEWHFGTVALDVCRGATAWSIRYLTPLFAGQPNPWGPPAPRPQRVRPTSRR